LSHQLRLREEFVAHLTVGMAYSPPHASRPGGEYDRHNGKVSVFSSRDDSIHARLPRFCWFRDQAESRENGRDSSLSRDVVRRYLPHREIRGFGGGQVVERDSS